jgi:ubiquinone/menaquinone biosynthesis C-methylase UbiE
LLQQYRGDAVLHLADCLDLPFEDATFDIVIVQGGLHHLPNLPTDLKRCLENVQRILKSDGTFYIVEPWMTPFLWMVHAIVEQPFIRKLYAKGDALAEMTDHERDTYEQWLGQPQAILDVLSQHFATRLQRTRWGKLMYAGAPLA